FPPEILFPPITFYTYSLTLSSAILCYPPPKIAHGRHSGEDDGEYTYGSSVTYRCDAGFSLIGSASISCSVKANGVDGEWKPNAPECKDVKCKRPTIPNGMVASVFQAEYVYDNVIKIVCDAGYTLLGSEHIKCGADNSWKPAVPTCAKGYTESVPIGLSVPIEYFRSFRKQTTMLHYKLYLAMPLLSNQHGMRSKQKFPWADRASCCMSLWIPVNEDFGNWFHFNTLQTTPFA
uniref:Sushi domain-containing protein n=1 Tax=Varanus komodoensis TaxID=61221 RepID=A0A8D2Q0V1_VARKO